MPLKQVQVGINQRVVSTDMNDVGDFARTGLALALKSFISPGTDGRILRGGGVQATSPASKNVEVLPLAGIDASGESLILEALTPKAIADNASGNPRIDLVSVNVTLTATDNESRKFWNPTSEIWFDQTTDTTKTLVVGVTVTQGVPSATPATPATPAGHIALATVAVADGFTAIQDADITAIEASLNTPIRVKTWQWSDYAGIPLQSTPFETPDLMEVSVRSGSMAVILAQVGVKIPLGGGNPGKPISVRITDDLGAVIGRHNGMLLDAHYLTLMPIGVVVGPSTRSYRVSLSKVVAASTIDVLELGDTYEDTTPLINQLIVVTI